MADPRLTYTISDFIDAGNSIEVSYQKLSLIETFDGVDFPVYNVIDDYWEDFKELSVNIELSDKELMKYMYKPRLLANDIYGNGELYYIILIINNICNIKEFNFRNIKLLRVKDMAEIVSLIYNAEKDFIDKYNAKTN